MPFIILPSLPVHDRRGHRPRRGGHPRAPRREHALPGLRGRARELPRHHGREHAPHPGRSRARTRERRHQVHTVVFSSSSVSNIGGSLTPLGDPPLFLGYLRGVPFWWTLNPMWPWAFMTATLLGIYYVWDRIAWLREAPKALALTPPGSSRFASRAPATSSGSFSSSRALPWWTARGRFRSRPGSPRRTPVKPSFSCSSRSPGSSPRGAGESRAKNRFSFGPDGGGRLPLPRDLHLHAAARGVPARPWCRTRHTVRTRLLLGDRARCRASSTTRRPTSPSRRRAAGQLGAADRRVRASSASSSPSGARRPLLLAAISCGAVFMGANTYIGNGPNFMVKADRRGDRREDAVLLRLHGLQRAILLPIFAAVTWLFLL